MLSQSVRVFSHRSSPSAFHPCLSCHHPDCDQTRLCNGGCGSAPAEMAAPVTVRPGAGWGCSLQITGRGSGEGHLPQRAEATGTWKVFCSDSSEGGPQGPQHPRQPGLSTSSSLQHWVSDTLAGGSSPWAWSARCSRGRSPACQKE